MDKEEFKRLQRAEAKAFKRKSKEALYDWGIQFEKTMMDKLNIEYHKQYRSQLNTSINHFIIAIAYTLHFSEETTFDNAKINELLKDVKATVEMFSNKEYSPAEYIKELEKDGIFLEILKKEEEK